MKRRSLTRWLALVLVITFLLTSAVPGLAYAAPVPKPAGEKVSGTVPSPADYLGFTPGDDRKLADWEQIKGYFQLVDEASPRVVVEEIGPTTLGDQQIMAIVSSPDTIARLDQFKAIQKKLADPRGLSDKELATLKSQAKTVVLVGASIHSTEIGGNQASLNALYRLASSNDAAVKEILDNTILLLVPSLNPDGHTMVVDWYEDYLGTEFEGTAPPYLYHHYAGHDDNRDWFMFNLPESRNLGRVLYHDWFPEIVYDIHQMGSNGARLFVPPFFDPPNWEIDPLILREIMLLGGAATTDLVAKGMSGVSTNAQYDTWWHGGMRSGPYYHNMVGLLTEAASVKIATPIEIPFEDLTSSTRGLPDAQHMLTNFPDVWPGGTWRLADIVAYEESVIFSFLTAAARYRDMFINNFVLMGQKAVAKGEAEKPAAFVIPAGQSDPATVAKMIEILTFQGVEVHQARMAFQAGGTTYPAGSYVVYTDQPYRANVIALLDTQTYPERREYPGGPAERPYDIAGWTLPLQMGIECVKIEDDFAAEVALVTEITPPAGSVIECDAAFGYAFGPELNNAATARIRLLADGLDLFWTKEEFTVGNQTFAPGTTIVTAVEGLADKLAALAEELSLTFYPLAVNPGVESFALKTPRVAIYENWGGNADAGWTRLVFDQFGIPYTHAHDADLKAGNLNDKFDVIILPDTSLSSLKNGLRAGSYPEEYTGGLGTEGLDNIKAFVEAGGTLLTLDSSGEFATDYLDIEASNVIKGVSSKDFYCPGSILKINVDTENPVAYGLKPETAAYFVHSPTYGNLGEGLKVIAGYPESKDEILLSGWLMGPEYIAGKAALVEAPYGEGRVIMVGFRTQHRGQPHGTYKVLFNSIFYGAAQ